MDAREQPNAFLYVVFLGPDYPCIPPVLHINFISYLASCK